MNSRRQFLGAAAAAAGLVLSSTRGNADASEVEGVDNWDREVTEEFHGSRYNAEDLWEYGWVDTDFTTIHADPGDLSKLQVEFRQYDSDDPDRVTEIGLSSLQKSEDPYFEVSTWSKMDVATARELAHIILDETEPVNQE